MAVLDTFRLDGKIALVTGGSRGLGFQMAHGLGEAGAKIAITARRSEGLAQAVRELEADAIEAMAVPCDISQFVQVENTVQRVLDQWGRIDVLVNNAGATWGA